MCVHIYAFSIRQICGAQAVDLKSMETVSESEFFTRIISWRNSTVDGHPWQVSITKALIS